jgi:hypothetical protein
MDHDFNYDDTPIAYFITFRSYGTWMHGDERGSVNAPLNLIPVTTVRGSVTAAAIIPTHESQTRRHNPT